MLRAFSAVPLALLALLAGCGAEAPSPEQAVAAGEPTSERLVVIGAGLAEAVVALGKGGAIVGVDRTARTLPALAGLPEVGMPQGLSAEGILALAPTAVLLGEDAGPEGVLAQLEGAGLKVERWTTPYTVGGALGRVERLGARLGAADAAATLRKALDTRVAALPAPAPGSRGKALFLYARGHRAIFAAGRDTAGDAILKLAGFENAFDDLAGMKPVDAEALAARAPAAIVIPAKSLASLGGLEGLRGLPGLADAPALAKGQVLAVDDLALLGFGPGLVDALEALAKDTP